MTQKRSDYRAALATLARKLRDAQGWKQGDLAERWGRPRLSVVRLEQGKIDTELATLAELAEAFDMKLVEFLGQLLGSSDKQLPEVPLGDLFAHMRAKFDEQVELYLAELPKPEAQQFMAYVALLVRYDKPENVKFVMGLVETAAWRAAFDNKSDRGSLMKVAADRAIREGQAGSE